MRAWPIYAAIVAIFLSSIALEAAAEEAAAGDEAGAAETAPVDETAPDGTEVEAPPPEPPPPPEPDPVSVHDARAQELFDAGDFEGALREQQAAQTLRPATPRVFNMAVCQERIGNTDQAIELYLAFMSAPDAPATRRGLARQRIDDLREAREQARIVAEATRRAASAEAAATQQTATDQGPNRPVVPPAAFWAMVGLTSASALGAIVLGAVTYARHEEFLSLYRDDGDSENLQESGRNLSVATNIMLGITGVFALTTLIVGLATDWPRDELTIAPYATAAGGGLGLAGRF